MSIVYINNQNELDYQSKEAYKTLRSNILFCGSDIKVIGFTSCLPNEGKSSVAINLAESLAAQNLKVLFIDADLRKTVLLGRLKIDQKVNGLTLYLSGMLDANDIIYRTNIVGLNIVFAGPVPPNPSELLGGDKFKELIEELRDNFDYIIIDTPPLGSVIDSAVVARVCDGMVLVMEANSINYKFAQNVKRQLDRTGCRILGAVLNKVNMNSYGYYGKYYSKYYGKYHSKYC
ncbi:MAG: CpsD/CapB family tyrosine-protein kinase [Clostridiales bacterium]|nr:CpsD/CapB family tyrosine-protein kinase [Clostridiales bacterium]